MAIKIIKEGKKEFGVYRVTCCKCQCVFECGERDATIQHSIAGSKYDFFAINCPNCGQIMFFDNKPIRKELI